MGPRDLSPGFPTVIQPFAATVAREGTAENKRRIMNACGLYPSTSLTPQPPTNTVQGRQLLRLTISVQVYSGRHCHLLARRMRLSGLRLDHTSFLWTGGYRNGMACVERPEDSFRSQGSSTMWVWGLIFKSPGLETGTL